MPGKVIQQTISDDTIQSPAGLAKGIRWLARAQSGEPSSSRLRRSAGLRKRLGAGAATGPTPGTGQRKDAAEYGGPATAAGSRVRVLVS